MGNTFCRKLLKADVAQLAEQPIRKSRVLLCFHTLWSSMLVGHLPLNPVICGFTGYAYPRI